MHPAKSVIFFTTATGAGYGLMFWLGVLALMGYLPDDRVFAWASMVIGFGLIVGGLLSSTFHLGHPERAWRAFSQWRSSWLSREGVIAVLTFIPLSLFAIYWLFLGKSDGIATVFIVLGGVMSLMTVFTTSMIYASLKTIPAWHNNGTKAGYLVFSVMSAALLLLLIAALTNQRFLVTFMMIPAIALLVFGLIVKTFYWSRIKSRKAVSTAESATGLGQFGKVSFAGSPHSADNYLLKEMGFQIARKHAAKLKTIALIFAFLIPTILLVCLFVMYESGPEYAIPGQTTGVALPVKLLVLGAGLSCAIGLIIERWLFFAEAKHVVTLYYGESEV